MPDLDGAALIREVHVYGQSLAVGAEKRARHNIPGWERVCLKKQIHRKGEGIPTDGCHFSGWNARVLSGARVSAWGVLSHEKLDLRRFAKVGFERLVVCQARLRLRRAFIPS